MLRFSPAACAIAALGASAGASLANSADTDVLTCLRANIAVTPMEFSADDIEGRSITAKIRNDMTVPLGGVWLTYSIWADDRPQPIYSASIRPAATIDGTLLPGEQMEARDFHFMSGREKEIASNAEVLRLTIEVDNAADGQMNGFLDHPSMGSWTGGITEATCAARES